MAEGFRVLLVDNGSTDGTAEHARRHFPGVEVIENARNLGFPGGNNVGIREALRNGAEFVILLNNDTVVDKYFARELLVVAMTDKKVGMVTSKIYFYNRPEVLWFAGGNFSKWTGRSRHAGYGEIDRGQFDEVTDIGRPCGCSLLVTGSFIEDVGLLNEDLFLYGEEIDYALRARSKGYKCLLAPRSKVWHKWAAASGGAQSGNYLYYSVRNMLRVLNIHSRIGIRPLAVMRNLLVIASFTVSIFTMNVEKVNGFRNIWMGVRDYMLGITGALGKESGKSVKIRT